MPLLAPTRWLVAGASAAPEGQQPRAWAAALDPAPQLTLDQPAGRLHLWQHWQIDLQAQPALHVGGRWAGAGGPTPVAGGPVGRGYGSGG